MIESLQDRTQRKLVDIESQGLTRKLMTPAGIDLSSNDYLGLARDHRVCRAAIDAICCGDGVGSTGSRLLRGHRDIFTQAEQEFAHWKGTERSLFFTSGYQANLGTLQTFIENGDVVFSDRLNHASLIEGVRLTKAKRILFHHLDVDQLAYRLRNWRGEGQKFLVTESLFSMDGDVAPLAKYVELCKETNTTLIVDEAHAVGLFGYSGSGLIEEYGLNDEVFLSINTGGKALGVFGAFVAGSEWAIEYLVQKARTFIFTTAPSPMIPAALIRSMGLVREEVQRREYLHSLTRYLRTELLELGLIDDGDFLDGRSPIISVLIGGNEATCWVAEKMQALGFDVRAIRPPTVPDGSARLRVSVNVSLNKDILSSFAQRLFDVMRSEGLAR